MLLLFSLNLFVDFVFFDNIFDDNLFENILRVSTFDISPIIMTSLQTKQNPFPYFNMISPVNCCVHISLLKGEF